MKLKYLSCPDLHVSPAWMETSKRIFSKIIETAKKESVDFVLIPGDLWDRPVFATEDGGLNEVIKFIQELREICPIAAIEGTTSHDQKGSYGALIQAGLTLILPGLVYSLFRGEIIQGSVNDSDCLIFGIPEPSVEIYQAKHKELDAEAVYGAITAGIESLCVNKIAPLRGLLPDIPAIGMIHGTLSDAMDKASETDAIRKYSAVITKTDTLKKANLDRWEAGHLHGRQEMKNINAGYAGFAGVDRNPYAIDKRDKIPSMNLGTIDGHNVTVVPVPYGTPMRVKISEPLKEYNPNVAYWLHTKDRTATKPTGHEWSKIDFIPEEREEREINLEAVQNAKTLREIAELYDPELPGSILKKFDIISDIIKPKIISPKKLEILSVEILGCKFWKGKPVHFDIESLPDGATQVIGKNGDGKSGLLGWVQPYPCFIGKSTESGHTSAIKDFFQEKVSGINKRLRFNGEIHEHSIIIKGAHTQSASVICTLAIDGVPILTDCKFKPMMEKCEELYGSMADYIMTTFYVQPLQSSEISGLMTASMSSIQSLVQKIAGIDYSPQKEFALEKIREIAAKIADEKYRIDADEEALEKVEDIQVEITSISIEKETLSHYIPSKKMAITKTETQYNAEKLKFDRMQEKIKTKGDLQKKNRKLKSELTEYLEEIEGFNTKILTGSSATDRIDSDKTTKRLYRESLVKNDKIANENRELKTDYEKKLARKKEIQTKIENLEFKAESDYQKSISGTVSENNDIERQIARLNLDKQELDSKIARIKKENLDAIEKAEKDYSDKKLQREYILSQNAGVDVLIESIKTPCPKCGYLDPGILTRIEELKISKKEDPGKPVKETPETIKFDKELAEIESIESSITKLTDHKTPIPPQKPFETPIDLEMELDTLCQLKEPEYETVITLKEGLTEQEIKSLETIIAQGITAEANKKSYETQIIPAVRSQIKETEEVIEKIEIIPIDISEIEDKLDYARQTLKILNDQIARKEEAIRLSYEKIKTVKEKLLLIAERRRQVQPTIDELEEWKKIDSMLLPTKLPAFELETFLQIINEAATEYIEPYRNGTYMFKLENQKNTKTKTVDKFDVKIHDGTTGRYKSFTQYSVGERSFMNDALVKALTMVRLNRMQTSYSPSILDEPDSFIDVKEIPVYHQMQEKYYHDSKVLIVSHQPEVNNFIESKLTMKELIG